MRHWLKNNIFLSVIFIGLLFIFSDLVFADQIDNGLYLDRAALISQQIDLLEHRLSQTNDQLTKLQRHTRFPSLMSEAVSKSLLAQAQLDISVAKTNLDSIGIELSESQQAIARLSKEVQETENQLNLVNIFGSKLIPTIALGAKNLRDGLAEQKNILELETKRADYLRQLQASSDQIWQFYKTKYSRLDSLLKSQVILQLKAKEAKSELALQQQQAEWMKKLNELNAELTQLEASKNPNKAAEKKLVAQIFSASENVNFSYLEMLVARYQDQIQQLRDAIANGGPVTLLDKMNDQIELLMKQLSRVSDLFNTRLAILKNREQIHLATKNASSDYLEQIQQLRAHYQASLANINALNTELLDLRKTLDYALKQELSSPQGMPGLDSKAWLNLGAEILLLPKMAFHAIKNLVLHFAHVINQLNYLGWSLLAALESIWIFGFYYARKFLRAVGSKLAHHEFGHVNLKWLINKLLYRNLVDIAVIGNLIGLLYVCNAPIQNFGFVVNLALVWLFFKVITTLARLYLLETVHDRAGADVQLYHRLKMTFIVGGITTALVVAAHGLPVGYEVKDFFARLFLLFLLVISLVLLKSWEVVPGLIIPHIDERRTYLKRVVLFMGLIVPVILIINSAMGLLGYVSLVYQISWYEGVFLFVMSSYLVLRGVFIEIMELFSKLLISHVSNGWLWTEAFLKPIDRVLRIALFLMAWAGLFILYGWNSQSPVVERLSKLIHYRFGEILNTVITPASMIELVVIISLLYWAAKWTREFVYRLLLSRTQDLGIRNSVAILSQYTMIAIGILVGLRVLGVDFRALTVVAGAFAVTAGLGLRDLLNNLASGFLLLIERPLRVGDMVTVDGHEGEVTHLGSRAVTVRTWDHVDIFVPNAEICSKIFINWTSKDNIARTLVKIQVNQADSPAHVQSIIMNVLAQNKNVLKDPAPEVFLKELTNGAIEFEARYFVNLRLIKSRASVKSEVLFAVWDEFEKNNIQPAYPTQEIFVKSPGLLLSEPQP